MSIDVLTECSSFYKYCKTVFTEYRCTYGFVVWQFSNKYCLKEFWDQLLIIVESNPGILQKQIIISIITKEIWDLYTINLFKPLLWM